MNERLKELMIQADYPAPELALRAHRLAELIVKECAGIIESQDVDPSFKLRMIWAVKEYFGVKDES
jgi:hypothetical protein